MTHLDSGSKSKELANNVILSPLRNGPYQLTTQKSALMLNNPEGGDANGMQKSHSKHDRLITSDHSNNKQNSHILEKERLEDQMNYEHLMTLEKIFYEANEHGSDGLDMAQFRVALKLTMGHDIDDRELDKIFMKVDTNCDGTVDWDEYLSYMLLEYQEKQSMFNIDQEHPLPEHITPIQSNHVDALIRITKNQGLRSTPGSSSACEADDASTRYFTMSKDGLLSVFSLDWTLQRSTVLDGVSNKPVGIGVSPGIKPVGVPKTTNTNPTTKSHKIWMSDFVCMSNCNLLAVGSTEYEVVFYSTSGSLIQKKFAFVQLADCALTLDFWFDWKDSRKCALAWGDTRGCITIVRFNDHPSAGIFTSSTGTQNKSNSGTLCISLSRIHSGEFPNVICRSFKLHTDWVRQVKFFTQPNDETNIIQIVSCCVADETALCFSEYTTKIPTPYDQITTMRLRNVVDSHKKSTNVRKGKLLQQRKSHFHLRKGILCFDFDTQWNLIVTGSRDCDIRVWNPYVVTKSSALLKGHKSSVTHIMVSSCDHMIISISGDKNIRLWDLRDYSCKQSIHGRNLNLGRMPITAALQNEKTREIILGSYQLGMLEPKNTVAISNKCVVSHSRPVTAVLYNPLFDEVVTASEDAMVGVWDIRTGQKQMLFTVEKDIEITALAFDSTGRRLITGSRNGKVRVWNFNNGACLRTLNNEDNVEISSIVCPKQYIITAGWNKKLTAHIDSYTDDTLRNFKLRHLDDILALAYHSNENILASSSYDGDILIWSLETEDAVLRFNVYQGIHSLPLNISQRRKSPAFTRLKDAPKGEGTERAVYALLMLESRRVNEKTAVLISAGVNCFVQAWSVHQRGGLVGRFLAGKKTDESILTLATNKDNSLLITGDSSGYLKIWDITNYCLQSEDHDPRGRLMDTAIDNRRASTLAGLSSMAMIKKKFLNTTSKKGEFKQPVGESVSQISFGPRRLSMTMPAGSLRRRSSACGQSLLLGENLNRSPGPRPSMNKRGSNTDVYNNVNLEAPKCTVSFRAHTKAISSIAVNESRNILITGSTDCSVRIWTMCGRYIGTLGQKGCWQLDEKVLDLSRLPQIIPDDVRRIASANTLRTIKGGVHSQWKTVKNALTFLNLADKKKDPEEDEKKSDEKKDDKTDAKSQGLEVETAEGDVINKHSLRRLSIRRPSVTTIWMDDMPMKTIMEYQPADKVEQTYQKLLKYGITSTIIGKHGWKRKYRRERAPLSANYERVNAPGEGPRPPLAPVAQLSLIDNKPDKFTVLKHNPVRWEAKHAIVYSRLPFATLETPAPPKIGKNILSELGQSTAVKLWQDNGFEQFNKVHGINNRDESSINNTLARLANRAKHVQRASKILKQRIYTKRNTDLSSNTKLDASKGTEDGEGKRKSKWGALSSISENVSHTIRNSLDIPS